MKKLIESMKILDIDGKDYVLVPACCQGLSGSMGAAFAIKKREGKLWVPKSRLAELKALMSDIKKDLKNESDLF